MHSAVMKPANLYGTVIILVLLSIHRYRAEDESSENRNQSSLMERELPSAKSEDMMAELPEFSYEVVQLSVPRHIKMNDMNDYHEIVLPAYSNTNIQLKNMSRYGKNVGFALIQVNAYEYNVTLSYTNTIIDGRHLTGLNLGLVLYEDGSLYAINMNPHEDVWVSLVLMLYNKTAPLPGGCNMEFPVEISPVMNLTQKESTIEVDTPPAAVAKQFQVPDNQCGKAKLTYESYYLTMPSYDFSQRTYFTYIRKLISYASAKASGRLNNLTTASLAIKRVYDRQVGRGMVFVTVAIDSVHQGFSAYVPVHTYACQPFLNIVGCYEFNVPVRVVGLIVTILMAAEIVVGFLPIFVKAFVCGGVIGMLGTLKIVTYANFYVSDTTLIVILVVGSIVGAVVFLMVSLYCPIAAIILCNFIVGFMLCSVIYYGAYGNIFYNPYLAIILLVCGVVVGVVFNSIQLFLYGNAILFGSAALFYGVNVVFSARLHYSLRNIVRGMAEDNYETVLSDPTLDTNEIMAVTSFVIILTICIYLRVRCKLRENQVVRAGFRWPCGDRGSRTSVAFLADDSFAYENVSNHPTITRWTSGDDEVFESPESNSRFFERFRRSRRQ